MAEQVLESVRAKYGAVAESALSSRNAGVKAVAQAFGYSAEELQSIPAEANMGLSCGNPTATAHIQPGEVVVDLGSGGGLDVFLAAKMVGPEGRAIGIDMTPAMIERARANAEAGGYTNVEFYLSTIDRIPLPDASVDCVISNCVLNLAPDKPAVFREIARVLKPGGRVAVSDIALKHELPEAVAQSMAAYVGCIAGSYPDRRLPSRTAGGRVRARRDCGQRQGPERVCQGGEPVGLLLAGDGLRRFAEGDCGALLRSRAGPADSLHGELKALLAKYDINAAAASVKVYAIKGGAGA